MDDTSPYSASVMEDRGGKLDEQDTFWNTDKVNELRAYLDQNLSFSEIVDKMKIDLTDLGKIARKIAFGEKSYDSIESYIILEEMQKLLDKSQTRDEFYKKINKCLPIKQLEKLQDRLLQFAIGSKLDYSRMEHLEEERLVNKIQRIINKNKNKTMKEAVEAVRESLNEEEQRIVETQSRFAKIVKELDFSKLQKDPE